MTQTVKMKVCGKNVDFSFGVRYNKHIDFDGKGEQDMKIALVDDDKKQSDFLNRVISDELSLIPNLDIRIFGSAEAFLEEWVAESFDFIILDIFMTGMTGVDLARKIRETDEQVKLAFCTSSNEFACESYEVNAQYYLHKPITEKNIMSMLKRMHIDRIEDSRKITLPSGDVVIAKNIVYTEYINHVIMIYQKDGQVTKSRMSQAELEDILLPFGYFCVPSKGMIANFHEVVAISDVTLTVTGGILLPISRRKTKDIKDTFAKFHMKKMMQ